MSTMIIYSCWVSVRRDITGIIKIPCMCWRRRCTRSASSMILIINKAISVTTTVAVHLFKAIFAIKFPKIIKCIATYEIAGNWRDDQKVIAKIKFCKNCVEKITRNTRKQISPDCTENTCNYFISKSSRFFFNIFMQVLSVFKRAGILFLSRCFHKKTLNVSHVISWLNTLNLNVTTLLKKQNRSVNHTYVPLSQIYIGISSIEPFKQQDVYQ